MGVKLERLRQNCFSFLAAESLIAVLLLRLPLPALHATLDLIGLGVLAWWYTHMKDAALLYYR